MAGRIPTGVAVALCICALLACSHSGDDGDVHDDNNFRPDVIECEDALDRLKSCCPDFDAAPILCDFNFDQTSGCGGSSTSSVMPAFSEDESTCIRAMSCDALVANKVCARAQAARAYVHSTTTTVNYGLTDDAGSVTTGTTSTHAPVCP